MNSYGFYMYWSHGWNNIKILEKKKFLKCISFLIHVVNDGKKVDNYENVFIPRK